MDLRPRTFGNCARRFDCIESIMPNVSQHANRERLTQLPNFKTKIKNASKEAHRFAEDWSEIRPEWD